MVWNLLGKDFPPANTGLRLFPALAIMLTLALPAIAGPLEDGFAHLCVLTHAAAE